MFITSVAVHGNFNRIPMILGSLIWHQPQQCTCGFLQFDDFFPQQRVAWLQKIQWNKMPPIFGWGNKRKKILKRHQISGIFTNWCNTSWIKQSTNPWINQSMNQTIDCGIHCGMKWGMKTNCRTSTKTTSIWRLYLSPHRPHHKTPWKGCSYSHPAKAGLGHGHNEFEERYGGWTKNRGGKPPQIINFNRVWNHYKPSILGYHYFWKHPYRGLQGCRFVSASKPNPKKKQHLDL